MFLNDNNYIDEKWGIFRLLAQKNLIFPYTFFLILPFSVTEHRSSVTDLRLRELPAARQDFHPIVFCYALLPAHFVIP